MLELAGCGSGGGSSSSTPATVTTNAPITYTVFTMSDLSQTTTYYWKIVAEDGNGGESSIEVMSFTTL